MSILPAISVAARSVLHRLHLAPAENAKERERRERARRESEARNAPRPGRR